MVSPNVEYRKKHEARMPNKGPSGFIIWISLDIGASSFTPHSGRERLGRIPLHVLFYQQGVSIGFSTSRDLWAIVG